MTSWTDLPSAGAIAHSRGIQSGDLLRFPLIELSPELPELGPAQQCWWNSATFVDIEGEHRWAYVEGLMPMGVFMPGVWFHHAWVVDVWTGMWLDPTLGTDRVSECIGVVMPFEDIIDPDELPRFDLLGDTWLTDWDGHGDPIRAFDRNWSTRIPTPTINQPERQQ